MLALPDTVSPLEIAWTLAAFSGACVALVNCLDAAGDVQLLKRSGRNGSKKIIAHGELSDQRIILLALVCKLLMGIFAMTSLPGRESDGDLSWSTIFVPLLMIVVALSLIYLSVSKKLRRKKLDGYLRDEQERATADETLARHAAITDSLDGLHREMADNTAVSEHAAERADAAFSAATHVNEKIEQTIEQTGQAGRIAIEAGNEIMGSLGLTGRDTNERVKRVEAATVDVTVTLTDRADNASNRLDKLEAAAEDSNDATNS